MQANHHYHLISLKIYQKVILLVWGSYIVDLLFTLFELDATTMKKWHPFYDGMTFPNGFVWDGRVSDSTFVYGLMSMLSRGMIFLGAYLAVMHRLPIKLFIVCFWIEISDMVDYYLFHNSWWPFIPKINFTILWIRFENVEFEYNFLKILIVTIFSYIEWKKFKLAGSL